MGMSESSAPQEGDEVSHEEFKAMAGGTIPFNLAVRDAKTGEMKIRCPRCDEESIEDDFEWVDTNVYVESVGPDGTIISHDIQSVTLECPREECGKHFAAY
jgi:hypothetical protein